MVEDRENEVEGTKKAEIRNEESMAVGEAYKAILWPTPGVNEETW